MSLHINDRHLNLFINQHCFFGKRLSVLSFGYFVRITDIYEFRSKLILSHFKKKMPPKPGSKPRPASVKQQEKQKQNEHKRIQSAKPASKATKATEHNVYDKKQLFEKLVEKKQPSSSSGQSPSTLKAGKPSSKQTPPRTPQSSAPVKGAEGSMPQTKQCSGGLHPVPAKKSPPTNESVFGTQPPPQPSFQTENQGNTKPNVLPSNPQVSVTGHNESRLDKQPHRKEHSIDANGENVQAVKESKDTGGTFFELDRQTGDMVSDSARPKTAGPESRQEHPSKQRINSAHPTLSGSTKEQKHVFTTRNPDHKQSFRGKEASNAHLETEGKRPYSAPDSARSNTAGSTTLHVDTSEQRGHSAQPRISGTSQLGQLKQDLDKKESKIIALQEMVKKLEKRNSELSDS